MSIKNPDVEYLARQLAERRRVSLTEAIRQALEHEMAREAMTARPQDEARLRRMLEVARSATRLPVVDHRSEDEILGYDQHGIPTR